MQLSDYRPEVEVWARHQEGSWGASSGVLISPNLVLTAGHVVASGSSDKPDRADQVEIRTQGGPNRFRCEIAWLNFESEGDAALLRVKDENWAPYHKPRGPVQF